ncbi:hypothetical protein UA08_06389 [Talaromyces atroroseus]|uniref:Purple acid phosphatase n=1 Tax=Talaromyces atroroseus TaxID=1441469 RepID=A0A225AUW2_TALAT|nr:hypothetical protein UA08_06389 [Talaromyces atroroseus]OKL58235.1 hypothetical protein UA08_06389 [Talaromyces atroroseus]
MTERFEDSSFVVITGPPQQDKKKRISHVRSHIRKSHLRLQSRHGQRQTQQKLSLVHNELALGSPPRQLTQLMDLPWLPVSDAVCQRLKRFFQQYIETSTYLHPFFRSMISAMVVHEPFMSAKLVTATTWDDLNGPKCEISDLTLFQRDISEKILFDTTADPRTAGSDMNIVATLTLLTFEVHGLVNCNHEAYVRYKNKLLNMIDSRGGLDMLGFDGNLKVTVLLINQLEKVARGLSELVPSLEPLSEWKVNKYEVHFPQPADFRIFTFERGEKDFWEQKISISTIRLLSDFFQIVGMCIRYQQLSGNRIEQQEMFTQWHFLRRSLVSLKSMPFRYGTGIDRILVHAIVLFVSNDNNLDDSTNELRSLLWESNVDAYYGPLPGALIWCLAVGARKSPPGPVCKWFLMQLTRTTCPSALSDFVDPMMFLLVDVDIRSLGKMTNSIVLLKALLALLPVNGAQAGLINYPPLPKDLTTPYQQRLAVYGPQAVSVGWNTYAYQSQSCVEYGTSSDDLDSKVCSTVNSTTYPTSRTYSNTVILADLTPATTYYYKIVSTNSTVGHFLSPRTPGDQTPFNLSVVIDLGVYGADGYTVDSKRKKDTIPTILPELNHTTIGRLAATVDNYEIILHPGDFAYADDFYEKPHNILDGKDAYQAILEQFYDQLAPISGRKLYMTSPGNHEADCTEIPYTSGLCPEGQRNFTDFMHRFRQTMPNSFKSSSSNTTLQSMADTAKSLSKPPFWYSFEYGMVHVTMIDTETDFPDAPDGQNGSAGLDSGPFGKKHQQLSFLEADLASVDRSVTPWVIVAGHRPWYTTGSSSSSCTSCQAAFEELFYTYGVDLGIFGHVHNSQRFLPVYNNTADPNGMNNPRAPMYIIAGGAGNIEGLSAVGSAPPYNAFVYADDYSYSTLNFLDGNNLRVEFLRSSTGEVLDSSTLYKAH